jgi:glycosyltransferase involved in cell wall biosynthesis
MAVSGPLANLLVRAGIPRTKVHCVPNGFAPGAQILTRAAARDALGIPADRLVVGWVGRLSPEKGPDVMLDALAKCDPQWCLSMVGEGRNSVRLRERAENLGITDRVSWHGAVADAGSLLPAFDAFVLSSRTEGTPIALLEAMYAGVPIVATRVGGVADIVTPSDAILVPAESPEAIARALEKIGRERSAAGIRSAHARETVRRSFNAAPWLAAVESVYQAAARDVARIEHYRPIIQN